jgi:hypothetical protein
MLNFSPARELAMLFVDRVRRRLAIEHIAHAGRFNDSLAAKREQKSCINGLFKKLK